MEMNDRQKAFLRAFFPESTPPEGVLQLVDPGAISNLADAIWAIRARAGLILLTPDQRKKISAMLAAVPDLRQRTTLYAGLIERRPDVALRAQVTAAEVNESVDKEISARRLSRGAGSLKARASLGVVILNVALAMFNLKLRTYLDRLLPTLAPGRRDLVDNLFSEAAALLADKQSRQQAAQKRADQSQVVLRDQMALLEQNIELLKAIEKILASGSSPIHSIPVTPATPAKHGHKLPAPGGAKG